MKVRVLLLLALAGLSSASLLEMSQVLWSRVLDGGYQRIGRLDPLRVPVVKVDQSEGEASYRVILRNLEVVGLNGSRIESVHIERGKLKSNLSDSEAGYVSYNEQRDLDSVRYRFHTLVKEPKAQRGGAEQFERIVQYDPAQSRARQEEDFLGQEGQQHQQQQHYEDYQRSRSQQQEEATKHQESRVKMQQRKGYQSSYGDMKVAANTTPRNPSQVRVHYSHNYKAETSQESQTRPCIGACRRPQENQRHGTEHEAKSQTRAGHEQRFDRLVATEAPATTGYAINANVGGSRFSAEASSEQRRTQFSLNGGSGVNYSGNYRSGQMALEGQSGGNQFSVKSKADSGVDFSGNYGNAKISVEGNSGEKVDSYGQPVNRFSLNAGVPTTIRSEVAQASDAPGYEVKAQYAGDGGFRGSFDGGRVSIESAGSAKGTPSPVYYRGSATGQSAPVKGGVRYICDEDEELKARLQQQQQQQAQRRAHVESTTSPSIEEFEPYKAPMIRLEKQPGYIDIVYASEKRKGDAARSGNLKADASIDPRAYGYEEIVKSVNENERYIIHNFTEGESLARRNDAARIAAESQRIKDLLRYAKEYQEKQGYYEEGMEFIYHFGQANGSVNASSRAVNESLARRKRQHSPIDKEEEDVMHVIVRIHVPELSVRSGYALTGRVGRQLLRGNGRLDGNFTNVVADFTVELKKVDNKTLIVRAARAKLVAKDHDIKLQGMDEKGPVAAILTQGLMASEAVAAMIADDLATKALSEGDSEDVVFKMYRNLPVIEKE